MASASRTTQFILTDLWTPPLCLAPFRTFWCRGLGNRKPTGLAAMHPSQAGTPYGNVQKRWSWRALPMVLLLVVLFVFVAGSTTWALTIHSTPSGIWGEGQQVELTQLLATLSQETGWQIFVDPQIITSKVTFSIHRPQDPERALRQMVRPYSHALVYEKRPDGHFRILQVRVFGPGNETRTAWIPVGSNSAEAVSSNSPRRSAPPAGYRLGPAKQTGRGGDSVTKPYLTTRKGAFGSSRIQLPDGSHGPDYRPTALQMAKAYKQTQQVKAIQQHREQSGTRLESRYTIEHAKADFRRQRNEYYQELYTSPFPH